MLALLLILLLPTFCLSLKVTTTSYGRVRGITEWSDDDNHKYIFKSVPFAKPPIGDLRFAVPQDPEPWDDVLDASKYSFACMSNNSLSKYQQKTSEDCLYINIFTSERCFAKSCAVIVYFHGGAFKFDSAVMFQDSFILERYVSEDVVFVIPAYRLGAFGQLYLGPNGVLSENLLLFDNVKALQFVHNEIANFGGDPNRVTIMGHSAGGTLIDALGFSKIIDPDASLFQQMITLSGQGEYGFYDVAVNISFNLVERVGCMPEGQNRTSANIEDIMKCMREADSNDILRVQTEIINENEINFKSIIRGAPFMELNGLISDFKKNVPKRNMICGSTQLEYKNDPYQFHAAGTFIDFKNPHEVVNHYYDAMRGHEKDWIDPLSSAIYISARTYCESIAFSGGNAYLFETWQKPNSSHLTDMQYFIGIHREKEHTTDMDILDSFYSKLLVNFTRTGVPSPEWEKLDPRRLNYLELKVDSELKEGPVMKKGYHDKEFEFWLGPVVDYDKNVMEWKRNRVNATESDVSKSTPLFRQTTVRQNETHTTTLITTASVSTTTAIIHERTKSIFEQWWFYLIILLIVMIFVLVFISLRKSKTEEETPLLN